MPVTGIWESMLGILGSELFARLPMLSFPQDPALSSAHFTELVSAYFFLSRRTAQTLTEAADSVISKKKK